MSIYGPYEGTLDNILLDVEKRIRQLNQQEVASQQSKLYEHLIGRVKHQPAWKKSVKEKIIR